MKKQLDIESENLLSFEQSVRNLAREFQGKAAFNFSHELELVMFLFTQIRNNDFTVDQGGIPIYLAHIEWPCILHRNIDLVIWKPGSEEKARRMWGTQRGKLAKLIPLLAAVQVKRGGGEVTNLNLTIKDLNDLENVYNSSNLGKPMLYFIEYADENLKDKDGDYSTYINVRKHLNQWCADDILHRRAFLISRDGVGFAYPKDKWFINPLPNSTIETR